jgi:hypothetical protein
MGDSSAVRAVRRLFPMVRGPEPWSKGKVKFWVTPSFASGRLEMVRFKSVEALISESPQRGAAALKRLPSNRMDSCFLISSCFFINIIFS